jgi:hypothetical protein
LTRRCERSGAKAEAKQSKAEKNADDGLAIFAIGKIATANPDKTQKR